MDIFQLMNFIVWILLVLLPHSSNAAAMSHEVNFTLENCKNVICTVLCGILLLFCNSAV